ncbi:uncharacterized protein LY89DRAFT_786076 [Mollisia scopiformis]|uniref:Mid2 domain-containing protein n=1 Tax=Mollisia scopiformis TaxID=149040 RepID=A0A194WW59_MOLSC|nr:uncharacterized protein LY89DRAFT_786076 [Mollisia scopiformis]KUJ11909.1 hypothetical protein LY89DRAFT_786076 [Mollisia scopiformis]
MLVFSLGLDVMKSLLLSLLFGALNVLQVEGTCYNPDGSAITDPAYQPCNQFSGVFSMCCGTNHTGAVAVDVCQGDGLCQNSGDSVYWRQGCTDKTWKSPYCLKLCTTSAEGGDASDNVPVGQCSDGSWCCGGVNATCCQDKLGVVIAATVGASSTSSSSSSSSSSSTSMSTQTSSSATTTPPSTSSTSTNTPTSIASSGSSSGLDSGMKIGIGVGIAGGVIAIIAVAGAFFVLRKRRAATDYTQNGTGPAFTPYQEAEPKPYPVEVPENVHRAELPNGPRTHASNVELAA